MEKQRLAGQNWRGGTTTDHVLPKSIKMPPTGCTPILGSTKGCSRNRVLLPITESKSNWMEALNTRPQNVILAEEIVPEISQNRGMSKRFLDNIPNYKSTLNSKFLRYQI